MCSVVHSRTIETVLFFFPIFYIAPSNQSQQYNIFSTTQLKICSEHKFSLSFFLCFIFLPVLSYLYCSNCSHNKCNWDLCVQLSSCCTDEIFDLLKAADLAFCHMCHEKNKACCLPRLVVDVLTYFHYYTVTSQCSS